MLGDCDKDAQPQWGPGSPQLWSERGVCFGWGKSDYLVGVTRVQLQSPTCESNDFLSLKFPGKLCRKYQLVSLWVVMVAKMAAVTSS